MIFKSYNIPIVPCSTDCRIIKCTAYTNKYSQTSGYVLECNHGKKLMLLPLLTGNYTYKKPLKNFLLKLSLIFLILKGYKVEVEHSTM